MNGVWHLVTVKAIPEMRQGCRERDILLDKCVADMPPSQGIESYGSAVYAVATRRLGQREIRQLPIPLDARK